MAADVERAGYFRCEVPSSKPSFCIMIPPPNVTGKLHMGHALQSTLQDLLTRWKRMQGFNALWLPGTDHAGIATQLMVERALAAEGTDRHELGRERFLARMWEWKETHHGNIRRQLDQLGASCDWSRERFTLDEGLSRAVREAFVRLHREGLISRGEYLVNWSPALDTAISDLEVEMKSVQDSLWQIAYPVEGATSEWWSPRRAQRRCSATPPSPSTRTTSATGTCSAGAPSCPSPGVRSRSSPIRWSSGSSEPAS